MVTKSIKKNNAIYPKLFLFSCLALFFLFLRSQIESYLIKDFTTLFMTFSALSFFMNFLLSSVIVTERDSLKVLVILTLTKMLRMLFLLAAVLLFVIDVPYYTSLVGQLFQCSFLIGIASWYNARPFFLFARIFMTTGVINDIAFIALICFTFYVIFRVIQRLTQRKINYKEEEEENIKVYAPLEVSPFAPHQAFGYFYWWSFPE